MYFIRGTVFGLLFLLAHGSVAAKALDYEKTQWSKQESESVKDLNDSINEVISIIKNNTINSISVTDMVRSVKPIILQIIAESSDFYSDISKKDVDPYFVRQLGVDFKISNNKMIVEKLKKNGIIYESGVREGDIIKGFYADGKFVSLHDNPRAYQFYSFLVDYPILMKQKKFKMMVENSDGDNFEVSILPLISNINLSLDSQLHSNAYILEDIMYIKIADFSREDISLLSEKLQTLLDSKTAYNGIVIDLRDNTGGLLSEVIELLTFFSENGKQVVDISNNSNSISYKTSEIKENAVDSSKPIAVLINSQTASAAEVFAYFIKDNFNSQVLGCQTYGKYTAQNQYKLNYYKEGTLLISDYLYKVPGREVSSSGLEPDIGYSKHICSAELVKNPLEDPIFLGGQKYILNQMLQAKSNQ